MSKNVLEIDLVIGQPPDSIRVAKVVLLKKGDLYISRFAPNFITSKHSYHESGISHMYVDLIKQRLREGEPAGRKLRGLKGHLMVDAWACPTLLEPTGYTPKPETRVRRTLLAPKAEIGWYCFVWAIERGRKGLVERIGQTNPWPDIPVAASLLADSTDPWILVTICNWTSRQPYQLVQYAPALPGRVPFALVPDAFEDTWLERPGNRWQPGEPFPEAWLRDAEEFVARHQAPQERGSNRSNSAPGRKQHTP